MKQTNEHMSLFDNFYGRLSNAPKVLRFFLVVVSASGITGAAYAAENRETGLQHINTPLSEIVSENDIASLSRFYPDNHVMSWSLFVPEQYDPRSPPGVIVYISPTRSGKPPAQWINVLENENMIYISTNSAGNRTAARTRMSNAIFALSYVQQRYVFDPDKTIISGFSGGARLATTITEIMPKVFSGGLYVGGAFDWQGDQVTMPSALSGGTYVFMTGKLDHARHETRRTYRQYRDSGHGRVKLIDTQTLRHELPPAKDFRKALEYFRNAGSDENPNN